MSVHVLRAAHILLLPAFFLGACGSQQTQLTTPEKTQSVTKTVNVTLPADFNYGQRHFQVPEGSRVYRIPIYMVSYIVEQNGQQVPTVRAIHGKASVSRSPAATTVVDGNGKVWTFPPDAKIELSAVPAVVFLPPGVTHTDKLLQRKPDYVVP